MLHAGLANANYFADQVRALSAAHYKAIVVDSRGQGRSSHDAQPYTYDLMADDVAALLDYLKVPKVALVGWSDGAIVGLDVAMRHPERLTKLFAFGAAYDPSGVSNAPSTVGNLYFARTGEEYAQLSPTPTEFKSLLAQMGPMWKTQPRWSKIDLARITTPTWIADGDHDETVNPDQARTLASWVPNAVLLIEPNVSHFALLQNPEQFNADLLRFLKTT
ncbi:MAG: alpha/beta hydrolase [Candidatus Baltobacteraceae bacterium]